jgi:hypothetical protein
VLAPDTQALQVGGGCALYLKRPRTIRLAANLSLLFPCRERLGRSRSTSGPGRGLQSAYRRSDLIESLHDGSFFGGEWPRFGLFLPAGIGLLLLWISGVWLFWMPFAACRRGRRGALPVPP